MNYDAMFEKICDVAVDDITSEFILSQFGSEIELAKTETVPATITLITMPFDLAAYADNQMSNLTDILAQLLVNISNRIQELADDDLGCGNKDVIDHYTSGDIVDVILNNTDPSISIQVDTEYNWEYQETLLKVIKQTHKPKYKNQATIVRALLAAMKSRARRAVNQMHVNNERRELYIKLKKEFEGTT